MDARVEPISCRLPDGDAARQVDEWAALRRSATAIEELPAGVRLRFPIDVAPDVLDLAAREAACCAFLTIDWIRSDRDLVVDITASDPAAQPVIALLAGRPTDRPTRGIGLAARTTGLSVSAIRYYERVGLITGIDRIGGRRRFSDDALARLAFIRRARDAGFGLEEIRAMLDDDGDWRQVVAAKLTELTDRRARLDAMISTLESVAGCDCDAVAFCDRSTSG